MSFRRVAAARQARSAMLRQLSQKRQQQQGGAGGPVPSGDDVDVSRFTADDDNDASELRLWLVLGQDAFFPPEGESVPYLRQLDEDRSALLGALVRVRGEAEAQLEALGKELGDLCQLQTLVSGPAISSPHYYSLPADYYSLLLTSSLLLTTAHYYSLLLTTAHYYSLLLTTAHYYSLLLTTC